MTEKNNPEITSDMLLASRDESRKQRDASWDESQKQRAAEREEWLKQTAAEREEWLKWQNRMWLYRGLSLGLIAVLEVVLIVQMFSA